MPLVEPLAPEGHQRIPWKNGHGELIVIDREGGESWQDMSVDWHFGRTAIIEEGPFSDYTGHERLQVVTKGAGLVLLAPDHEIDLRLPMHPRRYDGGTPIRTLLEKGPVEVVNLIADRARFDIDLRVGKVGAEMFASLAGTSCIRPSARRKSKSTDAPTPSRRITHCACEPVQGQMSQCGTAKSSLVRSTTSLKPSWATRDPTANSEHRFGVLGFRLVYISWSRADQPRAGGKVHP